MTLIKLIWFLLQFGSDDAQHTIKRTIRIKKGIVITTNDNLQLYLIIDNAQHSNNPSNFDY